MTLMKNPELVKYVTENLAMGKTQQVTADLFQISVGTVNEIAQRNRQAIEEKAKEIAQLLPSWIEKDIQLIEQTDNTLLSQVSTISDSEKFKISVADKRRENYFRSMNVFTSHSLSLIFNQIIGIHNSHTIVSPIVQRLLSTIPIENDEAIYENTST